MYDLAKHFSYNRKEILGKIKSVLHKGILELGSEVERFEENFSKYCKVKYCVSVSSGSMALLLSLKSLDLTPKDEVITVANSDIPTSHAITLCGAKIRWVDVDESSFNINVNEIIKNINHNTKAILPVHLFGNPSKMDQVCKIAKKHKLIVVEDACLAAGSMYKNKKIGSIGDITVFSTNPGKVLDGIGHGGIITTNSRKIFLKLKQLRDYGRSKRPGKWPVKSEIIGFNSKLSAIDAAVLNIRLKYLDWYIKKRNNNAELYKYLLNSEKIQFQETYKDSISAWRNFSIRIKNRNYIYNELYKKKLNIKLNYLPPNHKDQCYSHIKRIPKLPVTEKICSEIINLPSHPYMSENEIKNISKAILKLVD